MEVSFPAMHGFLLLSPYASMMMGDCERPFPVMSKIPLKVSPRFNSILSPSWRDVFFTRSNVFHALSAERPEFASFPLVASR